MEKEKLLTIDKNIYGLSILLTKNIISSLVDMNKGLTEFISIVNDWNEYQHMTYVDYTEAVLNWAYENFTREFYDKVVRTITEYTRVHVSSR